MRQTIRPLPALLALIIMLVAACSQPQAVDTVSPTSDGVVIAAQATTAKQTATPAPPLDAGSPAPRVTAVPSATATPSPAPTKIPTLTPTPRHPLDIEAMRRRTYGESGLTIEATLTWGSGFQRFIVSYLSEGNRIYALMTVPIGDPPPQGWPVIIFNHGYIPPDVYRSTERYEFYVEGFAQNGYIVFRSDYRGHGDSEGEAEGAYSSPAYTIDVLNGLEAVKTYPDADPQRIGMWGHSMGGYITLRAMVVNPEIKAGVIWGGVVGSYPDLLEHWRRDRPTRTPDPQSTRRSWRRDLEETYGSPAENPRFWAAISANSYVADLSGPIQLHHGAADSSVPPILSEILAEEIEAAGKQVELYLYEGDTHDIDINFSTAMSRSVAFFDRYVKGDG